MDLPAFASTLLARSEALLQEWYPAGKWVGKEYQVGNIQGEAGSSLSVNSLTGAWADFAAGSSEAGQRGGDLLSLYAAKHGLKQGEAATQLGWSNGKALSEPIPAGAPPLPGPEPVAVYEYGPLLRIARYEPKSFRPWTWRAGKWSAKQLPSGDRPLFGLDLLKDGTAVLLVEGEKAALAGRELLGRAYSVLTWSGGANGVGGTNWRALHGRDVDLWPDADEPGRQAMLAIVERLLPHLGHGKLRLFLQDGQPEGWDIADALADGWDKARLTAHTRREGGKYIQAWSGKDLQVGRPHDAVAPVASVRGWVEQLALKANTGGIPHQSEANVIRILEGHPEFAGKIWLDEFAQQLMLGDRYFERVDAIKAMVFMQEQLEMPKLSLIAVERAALMVADNHKRHPVKEWLFGLTWDGTDRLGTLMSDGWGAVQSEYTAGVGRNWLISMVARVIQPGCQADYMPVLESGQGIKKSSSLRLLVGDRWFKESHADPIRQDKAFTMGLQGHILVELPEMHQIAKAGPAAIAQIKGIITNRVDHFREPYGVKERAYPRQCIFCGSTNEETWNSDPTGGRRFWPITCGTIDLDYIGLWRQQLFAEALVLYRAGADWWRMPEQATLAEQEARREVGVWEGKVLAYMADKKGGATVDDILEYGLQREPKDWTQANKNEVVRALKANGYIRVRSSAGIRPYLYRLRLDIAHEQRLRQSQGERADDF